MLSYIYSTYLSLHKQSRFAILISNESKKMLKTKIIFYSILMVALASCKQEVKEQSTESVQEEATQSNVVTKDDAILEAYIGTEKVIFKNDPDKAYKDLVYYDHTANVESGLRYQIGGSLPYGCVVGIGLSTIKVGTYEFSRENNIIFTVDLEFGYEDRGKPHLIERSHKGSITITKSENNLVSGHFSGTGLTLLNDESLEFTSVKIHGTFENISLLKNPE